MRLDDWFRESKQECSDEIKVETISPNEKGLIKYKANDTIRFLNTSTFDTITYIENGFVNDWGYITVGPTDDVPCAYSYKLERNSLLFQELDAPKGLNISIQYKNFKERPLGKIFNIDFEGVIYSCVLDRILEPSMKDTLTMRGKFYSNAARLLTNYNATPPSGLVSIYSKDYGILRIELPNKIWLERLF